MIGSRVVNPSIKTIKALTWVLTSLLYRYIRHNVLCVMSGLFFAFRICAPVTPCWVFSSILLTANYYLLTY